MVMKKLGVIVRGQGKTRGAFGFALIFLLHFLHQGKKWKSNLRVMIVNVRHGLLKKMTTVQSDAGSSPA